MPRCLGTAGALVLAVSDNALVGVHLGQNETVNDRAILGSLRDQLAQFFWRPIADLRQITWRTTILRKTILFGEGRFR